MALFCLRLPQFLPPEQVEIFLDLTPFLKLETIWGPEPQTLIWGDLTTTLHLQKKSPQSPDLMSPDPKNNDLTNPSFTNDDLIGKVAEKIFKKLYILDLKPPNLVFTRNPAWGELLSFYYPFLRDDESTTCPNQNIATLPLDGLKHLLGLERMWGARQALNPNSSSAPFWPEFSSQQKWLAFIEELEFLGFKNLGELQKLTLEQWTQKFQKTGVKIFRLLHGLDQNKIPILHERERLQSQRYFEPPIGSKTLLLEFLLQELEKLFLRLECRAEKVAHLKIQFNLCYSEAPLLLSLGTSSPQPDLLLYRKILEEKLARMEILSPVQEIYLEILPQSLPAKQNNLFDHHKDQVFEKLQGLQALLTSYGVESGFLELRESLLPELSFSLINKPKLFPLTRNEFEVITDDALAEESWRYLAYFSKSLFFAPRPTRILPEPQELDPCFLRKLQKIPHLPTESIEVGFTDTESPLSRDYQVMKNTQGQLLWIFFDSNSGKSFLHGFFD